MKILDRESSHWPRQIISAFLEDYPFLQSQPMSISWNKKEATKGYAVGNLVIASINVTIPVIVKAFQLSPLDIMFVRGHGPITVTQETMQELLTNPVPFKGLETTMPKSNLAIFGDIDLQHSPVDEGKTVNPDKSTYIMRDAVKVGSFIDRVSADKESVINMLEMVKKANIIVPEDIIEKLAAKEWSSPETTLEDFKRNLEIDRQYVYQDELGNTFVKQANSQVDYTWKVSVLPEEVEELPIKTAKHVAVGTKVTEKANFYEILGQNEALYVNKTGEYAFLDKNVSKSVENVKLVTETPKIGSFGVFKVANQVTAPFEVVAIEKLANFSDFNIFKVAGRGNLIIDSKNDWFLDESSQKLAQEYGNIDNLEGVEPKVGDFGTFVVGDEASVPFEVASILKIAGKSLGWEIQGFDGLRKLAFYPTSQKVGIFQDEKDSSTFYVGGNGKFVKIGKCKSKRPKIDKAAVKIEAMSGLKKVSFYIGTKEFEKRSEAEVNIPLTAEFIKLSNQIDVVKPEKAVAKHSVVRDDLGLYNLFGPEFSKYAENHTVTGLNLNEASWALCHCSASAEEIAKLKNMNKTATLRIESVSAPVSLDRVMAKVKGDFSKAAECVSNIKKIFSDLLKEAAVLKDKGTLDAVLSLGLLKKHNVEEYTEMLPEFQAVASNLARLLLSVRLGLAIIPEYSVKRAMEGMAEVIKFLKIVGNSNRKVK